MGRGGCWISLRQSGREGRGRRKRKSGEKGRVGKIEFMLRVIYGEKTQRRCWSSCQRSQQHRHLKNSLKVHLPRPGLSLRYPLPRHFKRRLHLPTSTSSSSQTSYSIILNTSPYSIPWPPSSAPLPVLRFTSPLQRNPHSTLPSRKTSRPYLNITRQILTLKILTEDSSSRHLTTPEHSSSSHTTSRTIYTATFSSSIARLREGGCIGGWGNGR